MARLSRRKLKIVASPTDGHTWLSVMVRIHLLLQIKYAWYTFYNVLCPKLRARQKTIGISHGEDVPSNTFFIE